ncbi:FAD-binding oxidoreductase [Pseudanabaena biceps]|nr:FAD-binding oxidoreductase [Pseudanabaena biceps]
MRLTDNQLISLFTDRLGTDCVIPFDQLSFQGQHLTQRITQSLTPDSLQPTCAIFPNTIAQLSEAIALAHEQRLRVLPSGNATKLDWGGLVSRADLVISTSRLNQIVEHCVGDLTVTAEAGTKYQDLQATLAKAGQFLAINPPYATQATLGGILATGSAGSWRHRYNSVRDMCLGIEFVRSDGAVVKAGGRVVKNVAGYDLMKLLTGSYGTLGVVSQITFRLYPLPEYTQVVVMTGDSKNIAQAHQKISTSVLTPMVCDLLSAKAIAALGFGDDLTNIGLVLQFSGLKSSAIEQSDRIASLAKELDLSFEVLTDYEQFWQNLKKILWHDELRHDDSQNLYLVCKLGVLPSEAIATLQQCQQIFAETSFSAIQIHMGSGLGLLRVDDIQDLNAIASQITKIRNIVESHSGFLMVLEAPLDVKFNANIWGYTGQASDLMRQLQQKFDPNGLLSPNKMF